MTVELKNDISIRGTLKSVDQYLNIKLDDISVLDDIKYPHLVRGRIPHGMAREGVLFGGRLEKLSCTGAKSVNIHRRWNHAVDRSPLVTADPRCCADCRRDTEFGQERFYSRKRSTICAPSSSIRGHPST